MLGLSIASLTTILGALLCVSIGLADQWYFKAFSNVDLGLIGVGLGALLGHNPFPAGTVLAAPASLAAPIAEVKL